MNINRFNKKAIVMIAFNILGQSSLMITPQEEYLLSSEEVLGQFLCSIPVAADNRYCP